MYFDDKGQVQTFLESQQEKRQLDFPQIDDVCHTLFLEIQDFQDTEEIEDAMPGKWSAPEHRDPDHCEFRQRFYTVIGKNIAVP